ncbi:MAG: oligoendopeptidase F [Clostridia bacterium]|nr:oligoendopeptidase F [Clostridia bacterium]
MGPEPVSTAWRLSDIFPSEAAWEGELAALRSQVGELGRYAGRFGEGAAVLKEALDRRFGFLERLLRVTAYARLAHDLDTRDARAKERLDRATALMAEAQAELSYLEPEVLSLPDATIAAYLEREPGLRDYRFHLERLVRRRPHVLGPGEERVLALAGELLALPLEVYRMMHDADMRPPEVADEAGRPVRLTPAGFLRLMESPAREVRREAFRALYAAYDERRHAFAAALAGAVRRDVFLARARRHPSALAAALFPDGVPVAVYESLVASVRRHLPLLHRYLRLKRRALGLPDLRVYDLYAPIVPGWDRPIAYPEACAIVLRALAPLGEAYVDGVRKALAEGWVDVPERPGKRSGAYSSGVYGAHPYVLLNWQDSLRSAFTLAHELGHAMHSYEADRHQPFALAQYSVFVAEVASTTNEALLLAELLAEARTRRQRAALLVSHLENVRQTLFRQTMLAEFDRALHEAVERGGALTADGLSSLYEGLLAEYYGREVALDPEASREWMRIPHFYLNFYVYKYATGFSAAAALAARLLGPDGARARARYLAFLRAGGSLWPLDALRAAGVDLATPAPFDAALAGFERSLDELESLLA